MTNIIYQRWAVASLALCMLLASLATSIANVGLPSIALALHASFQQVQWVVLAYLLALTSLIVSVGRLGDLFGRKRLLLLGLALFALASSLCALTPSLPLLLAARALQGVGAAMMMSLSMAMVGGLVSKTGSAMGLLGSMSAIGTALGPSLGGILLAYADWRAIFWVQLPLGVLTFALAYRFLPAEASKNINTRFDYLGNLILACSLSAYALALTVGNGRGRGHFDQFNAGLMLVALVGLALFIYVENRSSAPLLQLALLRNRTLAASLASSALVASVMMATLVVGPFYLSRGFGLTATQLGLALSLGPLAAAITGVPAGRLVDAFGAARIALGGLACIAVACVALCLLPRYFGLPSYLAAITLATMGYALFQAANNTAVMANVPAAQRGLISGLLNLSRNVGLITGAAGMAALFAFGVGGELMQASAAALTAGLQLTFAVAALLIGLAFALVLFAPARWTPAKSIRE